MPAREVIQEYLVSLGATIHQPSIDKFNAALRVMEQQVESMTGGLATGFVRAGTIVTAALTSIAGATVGLMENVAQSDLQFQVLARRMFMTTDATRKMKMATDALGYSLEDIIFGPPELRERYSKLMADETKMFETLGMADFEKQMRQLRDIRFEFTRLGNEVKVFSMALVKDLSKALFGDENTILAKLRQFNDWFIENMPELSRKIATHLVPALRDTWTILRDIGDIAKTGLGAVDRFIGSLYGDERLKSDKVDLIDKTAISLEHVANSLKRVFDYLDRAAQFIDRHPWATNIVGGAIAGGSAGSIIPGVGTAFGAFLGAGAGFGNQTLDAVRGSESYRTWQAAAMSKMQWQKYAIQMAEKYKLDPGLFMAMIERESGWDPYAKNPTSTATGFGQFLKQNWSMYGMNALDPFQNMEMSARYLSDLIRQYGSADEALRHYGPEASKQPAYQDYIFKHRREYDEAIGAGIYRPMSYQPPSGPSTVNVGGVTVNVTQPAATAHEIANATAQAIDEKLSRRVVNNLVQLSGSYA